MVSVRTMSMSMEYSAVLSSEEPEMPIETKTDPPKKNGKITEKSFFEKAMDFFSITGQVFYEASGSAKFDADMKTALDDGSSIGTAGWQAFVLNKQNEMMLGNGSASPYARMSTVSTTATIETKLIGPGLKLADNKLIQHAYQWDIVPKGTAVTSNQLIMMRNLANHIFKNASTIKQGAWGNPKAGGYNNALFYSNGRHIIVTQSNGNMVTILKNATGNKHFNNATIIWKR